MIGVHLTRGFQVTSDNLDAHTDDVMDHLLALEGENVMDADVSAELSSGLVEISIFASADTFDAAMELADGTIRTAIHAAGGSTPNWTGVSVSAERELLAA